MHVLGFSGEMCAMLGVIKIALHMPLAYLPYTTSEFSLAYSKAPSEQAHSGQIALHEYIPVISLVDAGL